MENRYVLRVRKQICAHFASVSSDDVYVERIVELPFVPFLGLRIRDLKIEELRWDELKQCFTTYEERDAELYEAHATHYSGGPEPTRTVDDLVAEYEAKDWYRT